MGYLPRIQPAVLIPAGIPESNAIEDAQRNGLLNVPRRFRERFISESMPTRGEVHLSPNASATRRQAVRLLAY